MNATDLSAFLAAASIGWAVGGYAAGYLFGRQHGQEATLKAVNQYLAGIHVVTLQSLAGDKAASAEVKH